MSWLTLANNQMVSYTDAQGGGFTLNSGQSAVNSPQCMTKLDALTKYNLNATNMSAYTNSQLVPKIAWVPAVTVPLFIANGTPTLATGTSVSIPYPATVSAGDFILLFTRAQTPNSPGITTPSGFTLINPAATDTTNYSAIYYKSASGSEGGTSVTVGSSGASRVLGMIMQYRNVNASSPFSPAVTIYASSLGGATSFPNPNVPSTAANQLGVALFSITTTSTSSVTPNSWTYQGGGIFAVGTGHALLFATQAIPTSGTGAGTITINTPSATTGVMWTMFLNPI